MYNLIENNNELQSSIKFLNKEIELYCLNSKAILMILQNKIKEANDILDVALLIANNFDKNYAKASILYNQAILSDNNQKLEESKKLINSNGYSMSKYIIDNKNSKKHIFGSF